MYLSKLEIQGFKSFASKTVLEFPRGLTAVVGPNGSGKSNVADAVRWVLGEQSIKLLRGKKSEDVIFAGSDKKGRLGLAEVSMWLDNTDHRAPIDHSEVVITRRVYRSGEGEYLINKKPARLQDILLLLAQSNFGQKTYSVIGQGMVESFITSSPEQRKELFEDAAGVRQYQMKREQSLQKLSLTRENLSRVELLLQEIEPRLRSLTRQVKRLERRADVEVELRQHQIAYYAMLLTTDGTEREKITGERDELQRTWNEADQRLKSIQKELDNLERERTRNELFADLQKTYTTTIDAKNRLLEEQAVLKGRLELLAAQQGKLDVVLSSRETRVIHERLSALEDEAKSNNARHAEFQQGLKAVQEQKHLLIERLQTTLNATPIDGATIRQLFQDLDTVWDRHLKLATDQARLDAQSAMVDEERQRLQADAERMDREQKGVSVKDPKDATAVLLQQQEMLDAKVSALDVELKELRSNLTDFNAQEQGKKERLFILQKAFRDEQQTLNIITSRLNEYAVTLAKLETRNEDLEREMTAELPADIRTQIADTTNPDRSQSLEQRLNEIQRLKHNLELIGGIDEGTEREYEETKTRHDFLRGQFDDLHNAMASLEQVIAELDQTIKERFDKSFEKINEQFGKYFRTLFNGGQAKLILQRHEVFENTAADDDDDEADDDDAAEKHKPTVRKTPSRVISGIEIQATPPGKKVKSIAVLSGGERAMTAIALISAIIASNPSPFVVLDEVDAALDEANSARFAKIVAHLTEKTQFITITHNRTTMEEAQVLYGVTMGDDGISKLLSVKMEDADKVISKFGNRG